MPGGPQFSSNYRRRDKKDKLQNNRIIHHIYSRNQPQLLGPCASRPEEEEFPGVPPVSRRRSRTELRNQWCKEHSFYFDFTFSITASPTRIASFYLRILFLCTPMARLSGLQRDVLSLYRKCLREIRRKPVVSSELPNSRSMERKSLANLSVWTGVTR